MNLNKKTPLVYVFSFLLFMFTGYDSQAIVPVVLDQFSEIESDEGEFYECQTGGWFGGGVYGPGYRVEGGFRRGAGDYGHYRRGGGSYRRGGGYCEPAPRIEFQTIAVLEPEIVYRNVYSPCGRFVERSVPIYSGRNVWVKKVVPVTVLGRTYSRCKNKTFHLGVEVWVR